MLKLSRRKFLHLAAVAAALPTVPRIAQAQAWPTKQIRAIVPVTPELRTNDAHPQWHLTLILF